MAATQSGPNMAKPPGLRRRGGSWEVRVRVPERLRSEIGKTEIIRSFGGISTKAAYTRGWQERATIAHQFEAADAKLAADVTSVAPAESVASALSEEELVNLARRFLGEMEADAKSIPLDEGHQDELREAIIEEALCLGRTDAVEDPTLQEAGQKFAARTGVVIPHGARAFEFYEAIRQGWIEHLERQISRLAGATVATHNAAFAGVDGSEAADSSPTLAEAMHLYINAPERSGNSQSSKKMDRSRLGAMCDIVGAGRPVASITVADIRSYAEQLLQLPARYTQRFPGMSPKEAIAAAKFRKTPLLTATSAKRDMQAVKSLFSWLEKQELIAKNPARNLEGPRTSKKSSRRSFTTSELNALLLATPRNGAKPWTYWQVRIAMLQGLRFTEPLGLQVDDLFKRGDIWVFRIRENEFRTLKTADTAREVPVHPRLIELGVTDLVSDRDGDELLIPDAPRGKGKAFNAAQKQMGRLIRREVSFDPNLTFHSLRHGFREAMLDAGFPQGIEEHLGGWKSNSNPVMNRYGRGYPMLEKLNEWIGKLSYEGVEID